MPVENRVDRGSISHMLHIVTIVAHREILDFCWINVGKSPTMGPWGIVFIPVLVDSFFIPEWRAARNAYLLTFGVVTFLLEAACVK